MLLDWTTTDHWQHTARYDAGPGRSCRLSVERLAGAGWDWTVWCAQDPSIVRHGTARSRAEAIGAAERALPDLGCSCWGESVEQGGPCCTPPRRQLA